MSKILVVEDDVSLSEYYQMVLGSIGYEIVAVRSKEEAIDQVGKNRFHLLLVDKKLTREDDDESGLEFLALVRDRGINTPAIMASGLPTPESIEVSRKLACMFIAKPLPRKLLIQVIKMALGEIGNELISRLGFVYVKTSEDNNQHKYIVPMRSGVKTFFVEIASFIEANAPEGQQNTVCASSQIGCKGGCSFCFTADSVPHKYVRNLTQKEMEDLIALAEVLHGFCGKKVQVTFAGQGEPVKNPEVLDLIKNADENHVFRLTTALPHPLEESEKFLDELSGLENVIQLQISLHFADYRWKYMPSTRGVSIRNIPRIAKKYWEKTGKKLHLNWVLFRNINDSAEIIQQLANMLKDYENYVAIRLSQANEKGIFIPVDEATTKCVKNALEIRGFEVKTFTSIGTEYFLGCGMLSCHFGNNGTTLQRCA